MLTSKQQEQLVRDRRLTSVGRQRIAFELGSDGMEKRFAMGAPPIDLAMACAAMLDGNDGRPETEV